MVLLLPDRKSLMLMPCQETRVLLFPKAVNPRVVRPPQELTSRETKLWRVNRSLKIWRGGISHPAVLSSKRPSRRRRGKSNYPKPALLQSPVVIVQGKRSQTFYFPFFNRLELKMFSYSNLVMGLVLLWPLPITIQQAESHIRYELMEGVVDDFELKNIQPALSSRYPLKEVCSSSPKIRIMLIDRWALILSWIRIKKMAINVCPQV